RTSARSSVRVAANHSKHDSATFTDRVPDGNAPPRWRSTPLWTADRTMGPMNPNAPITSQRNMGARCHRGAAARKRIRAGVLLVAALVLGCASEAEFDHLDSSVTARALRRGKIGVLGVVEFKEP